MSLITLGVDDLARALRFYEALGWKRANRHAEVVFFQLNGLVLSLWSRAALAADAHVADPGGAGFGAVALAYNTRERADVDTVIAAAAAAGGQIVKPPQDAPWGGYSGYFADPDQHLWEVAWNPEWALDPGGNVWLDER